MQTCATFCFTGNPLCLQEHWFTIRRIFGDYWNFNSLFPAPQPLSQFYLDSFLATLREQGYTIFAVKGQLPQQQHDDAGKPDSHGAWFTPAQVTCTASLALHTADLHFPCTFFLHACIQSPKSRPLPGLCARMKFTLCAGSKGRCIWLLAQTFVTCGLDLQFVGYSTKYCQTVQFADMGREQMMFVQAKAANTEASTARQHGYLKAAMQGTLDKATKVATNFAVPQPCLMLTQCISVNAAHSTTRKARTRIGLCLAASLVLHSCATWTATTRHRAHLVLLQLVTVDIMSYDSMMASLPAAVHSLHLDHQTMTR